MEGFRLLYQAVSGGDENRVVELAQRLLAEGIAPVEILNRGLIASLERVGEAFAEGSLFLPEVMLSAHAVHRGMEILEPLLAAAGVDPRGSVVIGTVKGDQHDIGKNIVAMMLRGAGFRVKDLGIDVDPQAFVAEADKGVHQVVAMSCLLTTSLPWVERTIEALEKRDLRGDLRVLVGGAVLDEAKARQVGADGYAPDAARAVHKCKELMGLARDGRLG